jgi:hypothetical protein
MKIKTSLFRFKYIILIPAVLCSLSIFIQYAYACSVPVFRYALERWKPDAYKGIFIYRGEISEQEKALLARLTDAAGVDAPLNLIIKPVNSDTFSKEKLTGFLKGPVPDKLPLLTIWYPGQMGKSPPFLRETLTPSLVNKLVQSPKRQEVAESLIKGASVIWVFIPSGNPKKDDSALNLIRQELDLALKKYERNPFTILEGSKRKRLTYGFPIITLSRDDPAEYILIKTLMQSESDLYEHTDEPMVFPVFGRGRLLGCLFGEYITKKHIDEATFFLSGACSCEVKDLNPGVDLLMAAPWDYVVMNSFIEDEPLPELTGVLPDFDDAKVTVTSFGEDSKPEETVTHEDDTNLLMISGITIAGFILLVIISSVVIHQRRKE